MSDSIETSEREIQSVDLRTLTMRQHLPLPDDLALADQRPPAAEPATAQRLQQLADAARLALVLLKDDHATATDRDLVVAELERCVGLPADVPLEPHPPHRQCGCADCAPSFKPVPDGLGFAIDLLQRQPPKGWGLYRVPDSAEILISKPNGDGVRIQPVRDALLYELASAMLPPEPKP